MKDPREARLDARPAARGAQEPALQLRVRTGLTAGAGPNRCMKNLKYWQDQYRLMCSTGHPR